MLCWFLQRRAGFASLRGKSILLHSYCVIQVIDSNSVTVYTSSMQDSEVALSIEELAELVGTPIRTIRYYISEGLLAGPGTRGKAATYSGEHLLRLRLIRLLSEQRVPLATMREMLARLLPEEAELLLAEEERRAKDREQAAQATSPKEYLAALLNQAREARQHPPGSGASSVGAAPVPAATAVGSASRPVAPLAPALLADVWQRWELAPGIELHVRMDVANQQRRLIERLLAASASQTRHHP